MDKNNWTGVISVSAYMPTDMRYVGYYKNGVWERGRLRLIQR